MREALETLFGERGAVVAQFVITALVILALVAIVWWLVRRFTNGSLGTAARGRLPRLAIVDAMVVDNRRKLVLLRRDNVEHLILIGGPTDIVVEPGIVRSRAAPTQRPGQPQQPQRPATAPTSAAPPPAPPPPPPPPPAPQPTLPARSAEVTSRDEPIPFAPRRPATATRPSATREPHPSTDSPEERTLPPQPLRRSRPIPSPSVAEEENGSGAEARGLSARFAETARPTRIEQVISVKGEFESEDRPRPRTPSEATQSTAPVARSPDAPAARPETASSNEEEAPEQSEENKESPAAQDDRTDASEPDTASKVNDLEREMARLLGEISNRRSSS